MFQSFLLLLISLDQALLVVQPGVLQTFLQQIPGASAPHHPRCTGNRAETGQADTTKLFSLSPDCLQYQVSPLPGGVSSVTCISCLAALSPDGGNPPKEISADSTRVNRESEVAASFNERYVRDEDQVNAGNGGSDLGNIERGYHNQGLVTSTDSLDDG